MSSHKGKKSAKFEMKDQPEGLMGSISRKLFGKKKAKTSTKPNKKKLNEQTEEKE
jgi:hypothetical protein